MTQREKETKLIMDLAEDFAPFVKKTESGMALTQNHYGVYGAMISKLSKGNRNVALVLSYAMLQAGANAHGIHSAMQAFFPE
jgi:hypothetical protein